MLDDVFAFLQLGDVELGLGAIQPFEPQLVVVDIGDDGTETQATVVCLEQQKAFLSASKCDLAQEFPVSSVNCTPDDQRLLTGKD